MDRDETSLHLGAGRIALTVLFAVLVTGATWSLYSSLESALSWGAALAIVVGVLVVDGVLVLGVAWRLARRRMSAATKWIGNTTFLSTITIPSIVACLVAFLTADSVQSRTSAFSLGLLVALWFGWEQWRYVRGVAVDVFDPEASMAMRRNGLGEELPDGERGLTIFARKSVTPHRRHRLKAWIVESKGSMWTELVHYARTVSWFPWLITLILGVAIVQGAVAVRLPHDKRPSVAVILMLSLSWVLLLAVLVTVADLMAAVNREIRLRKLADELEQQRDAAPATHAEVAALSASVKQLRREIRTLRHPGRRQSQGPLMRPRWLRARDLDADL